MKLTYIGNGHHIDLTTVTAVNTFHEPQASVVVLFGNNNSAQVPCDDPETATHHANSIARRVNEACEALAASKKTEPVTAPLDA
jgi:hypothetical protein